MTAWGAIFCGNYSYQRGHWGECKGAWCGKCYVAAADVAFPIIRPVEEDGFDLTLESDKRRHLEARNGDHLLVPFQCDLCHFRNLTNRDPVLCKGGSRLIATIRRANLDAFWAREPGTVNSTRLDGIKIVRLEKDLNLQSTFPSMGPFPVKDVLGMGIAVCMLRRSLEKGRYKDTLQYETVRKLRSAYSNIWHASRETLTTSVMARDLKKTFVTSCPTYGLWFERFMVGMHKRMGDEVHQDKAVTLEVVHRLVEGLESEFKRSVDRDEQWNLVDQAVFILAAFLGALRGEEVFKLVLGAVRDYYEEATSNTKLPHVVLPLKGRFKGESGDTFHCVVVSACTRSGLKIGPWVKRGIELREERGLVRGFFFVDFHGRRLSNKDLENDILGRIARIQHSYPELIRGVVDVHEEYGLSRSFRRGSNSEAQNRKVSESDIDRNNRWRKVEKAGAKKAKFSMQTHYTDVVVALESYLRYSQAL